MGAGGASLGTCFGTKRIEYQRGTSYQYHHLKVLVHDAEGRAFSY